MKKLIYSLVLLYGLFILGCTPDHYLKPQAKNASGLPTITINKVNKQRNNARLYIPGQLNWDPIHNVYVVTDFLDQAGGGGGDLYFTGPNPIPTNVYPIFYINSCDVPSSTVSQSTSPSQYGAFSVSILVEPSTKTSVVDVVTIDDNTITVDSLTISDSTSPFVLILNGYIANINGQYYAVANSYQLPKQSPVPIIAKGPGSSPIIISSFVKPTVSVNNNVAIMFSIDGGQTWPLMGPTLPIAYDMILTSMQFKVVLTSLISSSSTVKFSTPGGSVTVTIPAGKTVTAGPISWQIAASGGSVTLYPG